MFAELTNPSISSPASSTTAAGLPATARTAKKLATDSIRTPLHRGGEVRHAYTSKPLWAEGDRADGDEPDAAARGRRGARCA
jgi:hypothetical protein